jgi:hypothetical protein
MKSFRAMAFGHACLFLGASVPSKGKQVEKRIRVDTRKGDRHKPGRKDKRVGDRHKLNDAGYQVRRGSPPAFLAIDGEGWGRTELGVQYYQLMVAANDEERYVLDTGKPLQTEEILDWLSSLPKERILISFSFGYDVTMLTKQLPTEKKIALARREQRPLISRGWRMGQPRPVYHDSHGIDWLPRKFFSIDGRKIYDTWSFFGKSLLETLKMWEVCTPEEYAQIALGKERRAGDAHDRATEIEYCALENIALCRIMLKIRSMCHGLGYSLRSYYGAGSVASAVMNKHGVDAFNSQLPAPVADAAQRAYFGGRFETASVGEFDNVYYYDIVSAYPTIIRGLPCLACGAWRHEEQGDVQADITAGLFHVSWAFRPFLRTWGPLPWRGSSGLTGSPSTGEGWYYPDELKAALDMYPDGSIQVLDAWYYETACDHKPFAFVNDLFKLRAEYKARGGAEQLVLKLGLNSLYGKTAQSTGDKKPYANAVWAGMITAGTRATLLRAIAQAPDDVLSTATDSISSRVPLDLPIGKGLGQWEHEKVAHIFIAGDGMSYSCDNGRRTRTRGIGAKDVVWERYLEAWQTDLFGGKAKFKTVRFEGLQTMVARGKSELAGRWHAGTRILTFGSCKRWNMGAFEQPHNTIPWPMREGGMSAAYDRQIGLDAFAAEDAVVADAKDSVHLFDEIPI